MKHKRYGTMKLKNHLSNCFCDCFFLLFGIACIAFGISGISAFVFLFIAIVDIALTLTPYREEFAVSHGTVTVYEKGEIKHIILPDQMTIVISYADMCTDLAKRVTLYNSTYMLKGEWAVSLLEDISAEKVIGRLHKKGAWRYTNCWVEEYLKQHYIYSFVCDQKLLEEVLSEKNYIMIIPESLLHEIDTEKINGKIYIDKGF